MTLKEILEIIIIGLVFGFLGGLLGLWIEELIKKKNKKIKFEIHWLEYHICETKEDEKFWEENLPNCENFGNVFNDDVVEFEATDYFTARNIQEAKDYVVENYDMDIFSVYYANTRKRVFTEEDYLD